MTAKRTAFIYARVSDPSKGDRTDATASIPRQRTELAALAKKNGDVVLEVFEEAQTAHEAGRPEFDRMMARLHEVQAVYVVAYDRLTRIPDPTEQEAVRKAFKAAQVDIVTPAVVLAYSDPAYDSPETRLHLRALGMFGAFEWDSIVRRLRKGKVSKVEAGAYYGHPVPYGYSVSFDPGTGNKIFTPDEAQAAVVRTIFALYLEGYGAPSIIRELNQLGVPAPRGGAWNSKAVRDMLKQELYVGRSRFGGKSRFRKPGQERITETPIVVDSQAFPPIVEMQVWDAVQQQRPVRSMRREQKTKMHPLAGIVICPGCGRGMPSHGTWKDSKLPFYYGCRSSKGEVSCDMRTYYNMDTAHEAVFKWLLRELPKYATGKHRKKQAEKPKGTEMVEAAQRRVADAERKWTAAANMAEQGIYTPEEARERFEKLREEIKAAKGHLEALTRTQQAAKATPMPVDGFMDKLRLMEADAPELREVYAALLAEVHLKKLPKTGRTIPLAVERVRFVNGEWYPSPPPA